MSRIQNKQGSNYPYQPTHIVGHTGLDEGVEDDENAVVSPLPRYLSVKSFVSMGSLIMLGILAALSQHEFYSYVNGRRIEDVPISQDWVIRVGTACAFLFQTVLVSAVSSAYTQRFWYAVRRESLSVSAMDAMFGVLGNPLQFINVELIFKTKMLFLFAIIAYLVPIATILSPVVSNPTISTSNTSVPTLSALDHDAGFIEIGSAASYLGASDQLRRIAARVLTTGEIVIFPSPCGSNCTYNISFIGPAYSCSPFNPLSPLPNLTAPYYAQSYMDPTEYNGLVDYYSVELYGNSSTQGLWVVNGYPVQNYTVHCTVWNATYTTNVNFTNNIAVVKTNLDRHKPLNTTEITSYEHTEFVAYSPSPNETFQQEIWKSLNIYSIHNAVATNLRGYVVRSSIHGGFGYQDTLVGMASFTNSSSGVFALPRNLSPVLEDLLVNTTLSVIDFLRRPALIDVNDNNITQPAIYTLVPATIITYPSTYSYDVVVLWEAYGVTIGVSAVCIIIGAYMLWDNGVDAGMEFSQVLVTTRNPTLDKICAGAEMGGDQISDELKITQLRFGILRTGEQHPCFGIEDEIIPLKSKKQ